jgi:hypothetical protein
MPQGDSEARTPGRPQQGAFAMIEKVVLFVTTILVAAPGQPPSAGQAAAHQKPPAARPAELVPPRQASATTTVVPMFDPIACQAAAKRINAEAVQTHEMKQTATAVSVKRTAECIPMAADLLVEDADVKK